MSKGFPKFLIAILCLLAILLGFAYVHRYGVSLLYWDEFGLIEDLFQKYVPGELAVADLFKLHNEHRIFFPRLLALVNFILTGYNSVLMMYMTQLALLAVLVVAYLKASEQFGFSLKNIPLWFLPIPFLIMNWRQSENTLWGFQISFVMPLLFTVLAIYMLDRWIKYLLGEKSNKAYMFLALAFLFATVATFSSAMGLIVWIIGGAQLVLLIAGHRQKWWPLIVWAFAGVLEWSLYMRNFHKPASHPSLSHALSDPLAFVHFYLVEVGSICTMASIAFWYGLITAVLCCVGLFCIVRRGRLVENSFWLAMMLFSFMTMGMIGVSRCGFGLLAALSSRYVTYSIPVMVGLLAILASAAGQGGDKKVLRGSGSIHVAAACVALFGAALGYAKGFMEGGPIRRFRTDCIPINLQYEEAADQELGVIFPDPNWFRHQTEWAEANGVNVFAPHAMKKTSPGRYMYTYLRGEVLEKVEKDEWTTEKKWKDSVFENKVPKDLNVKYVLSSHMTSDMDRGRVQSRPIAIKEPSFMMLYIMYGPDRRNQRVGLDTDSDGKIDKEFVPRRFMFHVWEQWCVDLSEYKGGKVSVIAEDTGSDWGRWVGISQPIVFRKTGVPVFRAPDRRKK